MGSQMVRMRASTDRRFDALDLIASLSHFKAADEIKIKRKEMEKPNGLEVVE